MAKNSKKGFNSYTSSDEEQPSNYVSDEQLDEEDEKFPQSKDVSMEELIALQEKIGTKAFANKIMKMKSKRRNVAKEDTNYKRANKNRPRKLPLMRKLAPKMKFIDPKSTEIVKPSKSSTFRDPRFDDLSGKLDTVAWKKNYKFLYDMRHKEKQLLEKTLKKEKDTAKRKQLLLTIQRMENQEREQKKHDQERELKKQQREAAIACMKEGRKPKYLSQKEKTLALKISHFESLANENKVEKYLKRKEKKIRKKEF